MIIDDIKITFVISILSIFVASCATLNKDECRTADWKLIGFEDGSKGYSADRVGQHRQACAEYGVTPNLNLYNQGRAEGLHKYCIPVNGYNLGQRGSSYKGVCSGYDEQRFVLAYKGGKLVYSAKYNLGKMKTTLDNKQKDLDHVVADIHDNEQQIINGKLSKSQIVILLLETKDLAVEQGILIKEIHDLKGSVAEQTSYISHLQQQYNY